MKTNIDKREELYLTETELDEISELKTVNAALDYIKNMEMSKRQLVMKQFFEKMAVRQWQTIAAEKY